jgi:DNA-binding transcriptional regulator YhcF (GntR family)
MDTLTWAQLSSGDYQAQEHPLRLTSTVSHRGRHMWRLRVPHERDASYPGGWSWRDALPHGTAGGPVEAAELPDAIAVVESILDTIVRRLPVDHVQTPPRLDPDDPRPHHEQLAELLRAQVTSGDLGPGEQLPTQRHLAAHFGVSKATVHRAQVLLQTEGLLVIKRRGGSPGGGVFVRSGQRPARPKHNHAPACCCQPDPREDAADQAFDRVYPLIACPACPVHGNTPNAYPNGNPNRGSL